MSKVLVIPDVHLKPEMFDHAEAILKAGKADYAVQLGDLVDDWGKGTNIKAYEDTFERAIKFANDFPNTVWVCGNHDFAYLYKKTPSGHSLLARDTVSRGMAKLIDFSTPERVPRIMFRDTKVLFSHAGISLNFLPPELRNRPISDVMTWVNSAEARLLWQDESPLWWRPLDEGGSGITNAYRTEHIFQATGHTPVEFPIVDGDSGIMLFDTWSTCSDGSQFGNKTLCVIDTEAPSLDTTAEITYEEQLELMK